jgi:heme-degrading monooxygenase HmoA
MTHIAATLATSLHNQPKGVSMHTLIIEGTFKPGTKEQFIKVWKNEILPNLKKQNGFVDEVLLFGSADPNLGVGLSFWKTKEDAERYHREVFPNVAGSVQQLITAPPSVRQFEVAASETFRVTAGKAA